MKILAAAAVAVLTLAGSQAWALPSRAGAAAAPQGLTLFAPAVAQDVAGARIEGAICRLGPTPSARIGELTVERLGADGNLIDARTARVAPALRDRGPTCAYYHLQTAWTAGDRVQVCLSPAAGGPRVCAAGLK